MFSGIVEETGTVSKIVRRPSAALLEVRAQKTLEDAKTGDSIAVNGVCLTVVAQTAGSLSFEAIPETMRLTNLGDLKIGDKVNLERSLRVGERISGHFVTGHIDTTGIIRKKTHEGGNSAFEISFPASFIKYVILKGSVAIDGISLTIARARSNALTVFIIPHTLAGTTLGFKGPSSKVNLEFDILAKRR